MKYSDAFIQKWNERVNQFTSAADSAVYWWIDKNIPVISPLMGGIATLATKDNIGSTLATLSYASGIGAARAFFIGGRNVARMANISVVFGVGSDVVSGNDYTVEKVGIEAASRVMTRFGPADELGSRIHNGINQIITTWTGYFVGKEE